METRDTFHRTLEHVTELITDATCSVRDLGIRPLPSPHRRLLTSATRSLESAQQAVYLARTNPWHKPPQKHRQLELL